jgi:hypothetical protein
MGSKIGIFISKIPPSGAEELMEIEVHIINALIDTISLAYQHSRWFSDILFNQNTGGSK